MQKTWIIYKIEFPNGKVYIGQTYNFKKRIREHLHDVNRYDYKVYRAIAKYHITKDNFSIIEDNILTIDEANDKEKYYILLYDSYNNGYNSTLGGNNTMHISSMGEKHAKAKISDNELYNIRKLRADKTYTCQEVYEMYKDKCSYEGFSKLWNYLSRKNIAEEYNLPELRDFYRKDRRNRQGDLHSNSNISDNDVISIRYRYYILGEKTKEIYQDYKDNYSLSGFTKIITGESHKHIPIPEKTLKCKKRLDRLTDDEVIKLRLLYKQGYSIKELHVGKYLNYSLNNFKNMLIGKTYTHI